MSVKIHIILPVHNRLEETGKFIECLKKQTYNNYHLILVDDGSTDGTADMVRREISELTVITGKGNWWWGGGLHQGYLWLLNHHPDPGDIVLLINDDTTFDEDFFSTAVDVLEGKEQTLLLAECYDQKTGEFIEGGIHADWLHLPNFRPASTPEEINCLPTRGLFFRVRDFFEIEGFHPFLLPHYGSDYEFTIRAHRKGFSLMTDSKLKLSWNVETTGDHSIFEDGIITILRKHFSKRSSSNPFYWFSFVLLCCPKSCIIPHIYINLKRLVILFFRNLFGKKGKQT